MIDNDISSSLSGVDKKKIIMGLQSNGNGHQQGKKSIEEQLKEIEAMKQNILHDREALEKEKQQFEEERKMIFDSLQKCIGSGSANIGRNLSKAYKKVEKIQKKSGHISNGGNDIGIPFNVQHKVHVDFNFKWSGNDLAKEFEFQEELGTGSYGSVHKAVHKESHSTLAIKVIPVTESEEIEKEITILKACNSPNIVSYFGSCQNDDAVSGKKDLWIMMDYCSVGSLRDMMDLTEKSLTEKQLSNVMQQALKGLHYLHSNQIIHRDIKAANILLNEDAIVKLADFGVSAQLDAQFESATDFIGTPLWMPPEIVAKKPYNNKCDIWSLGITCIELIEFVPPYSNMPPTRAMLMIPNKPPPTLNKPHQFSKELNDFISKCCQKDPSLRPSALDLLMHPFITGASSSDVLKPLMEECLKKKAHNKKKSMQQSKSNNKPLPPTPVHNNNPINASKKSDSSDDTPSLGTFVYKANGKTSSSVESDDDMNNMSTIVCKDDSDDNSQSNIPAFIAALRKSIKPTPQDQNNNQNNQNNNTGVSHEQLNQLQLNIKEISEKQDAYVQSLNTFKQDIIKEFNDKLNLILSSIQSNQQQIQQVQQVQQQQVNQQAEQQQQNQNQQYSFSKKIFPPPPPVPQAKSNPSSNINRRSREMDGIISNFNNMGNSGSPNGKPPSPNLSNRPPSQQQKRHSGNLSNRPQSPKPNQNHRPISPKPQPQPQNIVRVLPTPPSTLNNKPTSTATTIDNKESIDSPDSSQSTPTITSTPPPQPVISIIEHPTLSPQTRSKPAPPPRTPPRNPSSGGISSPPPVSLSKRPPSPNRKSQTLSPLSPPPRKPAPLPPVKTPISSPSGSATPASTTANHLQPPKSPYTPPPSSRIGSGNLHSVQRISQTLSGPINPKRLSSTMSPIMISSPTMASQKEKTTPTPPTSTPVTATTTTSEKKEKDDSLSGSLRKKPQQAVKSIQSIFTPKKEK